MESKFLRYVAFGLCGYAALHISACQIYDATVSPRTAEGLVREQLDVPNGMRVSYLAREGSDDSLPRIIYVHGTPGNATAFERYLVDPIDGFQSIAYDRPGFGLTRPKRAVPSLKEQAEVIEPFLEERNGRWPILVGHSLGAPIAAQAALDFPGRVDGLVLLAGSLDPDEEIVYWIQRLGNFAVFPYFIPAFLRNSNRELIPLRGELEALGPQLRELRLPISIVHSRDDMLVPYRNVEYMCSIFDSDAIHEVMTLEDKDHFIPWNAEEIVRAAIRSLAEAASERTASEL